MCAGCQGGHRREPLQLLCKDNACENAKPLTLTDIAALVATEDDAAAAEEVVEVLLAAVDATVAALDELADDDEVALFDEAAAVVPSLALVLTVQFLTSWTAGLPLESVMGVKVMTQVWVRGPEGLDQSQRMPRKRW